MSYTKPRRRIHSVFIHCSASDHPAHDDPAVMKRWHLARGFSTIGYHYVITKDGTVHTCRPVWRIPAAQQRHNSGTIAVCLTGRRDFTPAQFDSLRSLCREIQDEHPERRLRFRGHKEVANKACPVFPYRTVLGLNEVGHLPRQDSTEKVRIHLEEARAYCETRQVALAVGHIDAALKLLA